ncbi:LexA family protein [Aquicella lusitana]|uniref:SOS response UmuD protein n=1 Tax=Aquicella lusitana TaxID=254246 RepID=A0A370GE64_9COXI|nr:translesion error-prone DNA polymerase V autoproteolytic subunit [Aquicella lusitana]RDI42092.1 SOS response UmuD protein [Aquicella lusitana]VVC74401.1 LexA repressor [Aquicella lusitana]
MPSGGARVGAGRPKGKGKYQEPTKAVRLPISMVTAIAEGKFPQQLPLYLSKVSAGFPSPAEDDIAEKLDLNEYLIKHPAATFLVRANGHSMINAGIHENDILVVDRSLTPTDGKIVIAAIDGQLTVKRLRKNSNGQILLQAENPGYKPIEIREDNEVHIWGVVTSVIHSV